MRHLPLVAIVALSACGGGGGGGSSSTTSSTATTTTSSVMGVPIPSTFQGPSETQTLGLSVTTGTIFTNSFAGAQPLQPSGSGASVTIVTNERNEVTRVAFAAPGFNETFTVADTIPIADTLSHGDLAAVIRTLAAGDVVVGTDVLSYSAYGAWALRPAVGTPEAKAGVFATGRETPPAGMPQTGTATYSGRTIGFGGTNNFGSAFTFGGNATLTANFGTGAVTTTFSGLQTQNIQSGATGTLPSIGGSGTIAGNAFSTTLASNGFTGDALGRFYGPAAQEAAGVWRATDGASAPNTISLMGSFAAAR